MDASELDADLPADELATLPVRERILRTALRLFYRQGVRATGIDRIIAESGVAKASFYRQFPSKDDLVVAYLARRHERWMAWFTSALEAACATRGPALVRVAEVLGEWFASPRFTGCAFINFVAEGSPEPQAWALAQSHKAEVRDALLALAQRAGLPSAGSLADAAALVVEGAIVQAQMTPGAAAARSVARNTSLLLGALEAGPTLPPA